MTLAVLSAVALHRDKGMSGPVCFLWKCSQQGFSPKVWPCTAPGRLQTPVSSLAKWGCLSWQAQAPADHSVSISALSIAWP